MVGGKVWVGGVFVLLLLLIVADTDGFVAIR